ncbi:hypothetical protein [Zoogloea sp.]|uniref:hypothetical protein n=1 Tax=Zoogloea sp. TaxID=49181 RepID=UPI0035B1AF07
MKQIFSGAQASPAPSPTGLEDDDGKVFAQCSGLTFSKVHGTPGTLGTEKFSSFLSRSWVWKSVPTPFGFVPGFSWNKPSLPASWG